MAKIIVDYIGTGIWVDGKGNRWAKNAKDINDENIKDTRDFESESLETFKEERSDIGFMLEYGQMKSHVIASEPVKEAKQDAPKPFVPPIPPAPVK